MNNNKKINKLIFTMVGLTAFTGVLFAYDNFYLADANVYKVMYVAKEDIPTKTTLTQEMFQPISIHEDGILDGYVTNLNQVVGKQLNGSLLKNEPLSTSRLSDEVDLEHMLEIKIESDPSSISVTQNDYINLYVILFNNNDIEMRKVFENKQINVETLNNAQGEVQYLTMEVNEEEVEKYYSARERGKIILVKNNDLNAGDNILDYNPNSSEAINSQKPEEQEDGDISIGIITKTFEEGDTLEALSIEYKTTIEDIQKLNEKEEFNVGDSIILPAN